MNRKWIKTQTCHVLQVGDFQLCVWPLSGDGPFELRVVIPIDGNSNVLPCLLPLPTVALAKTNIVERFREFLTDTLTRLPQEES